jgi:hypothetical protein
LTTGSGPWLGFESHPEPYELASPAWKPIETADSDGLENCLLVLATVGFLTGAPGPPHLVAEPLWHLIPVAAAHQASRIDLITAAGYRAEAYRQR